MARDSMSGAAIGKSSRRRSSMADSATSERQCHQKKIFVGGLGHETSTQTLQNYFKRYGSIVDAVVLRWPDGRSRGFGYVTFADASAVPAVQKDTHKIAGSAVDVQRAVPGTNKLFVGGLPQNTPAVELRQHFERFGAVSDAVVMMDPATGRSRGFGFICFSPGQDGAAALSLALKQYDQHYIRGKWIEVKSAAPPRQLGCEAQTGAPPTTTASHVEHVDSAKVAPLGLDADSVAGSLHYTAPGFSPPPGLEESWAPAAAPAAGPQPRHSLVTQLPEAPPLPSLLGARSQGHFSHPSQGSEMKAGLELGLRDPVKVPYSGPTTMGVKAVPDMASGVFDASADLRRSLEQLLRSQCDPRSSPSAR